MPGGVCAVLDYESEMMADYVADMATRVVMPRSTVAPAFRKFVHQMLTSTRLPSTTILLGMNYLAKYINLNKHFGVYDTVSEGELWKMVTVGLMLGSKFMDDNTFQNRSWADVSGISVPELNAMEIKWLTDMEWNLFVNLDRSHDYEAWLKSWEQYRGSKQPVLQKHQAVREKLAPIVTGIHNDGPWWAQASTPVYESWDVSEREWYMRRAGQPDKVAYRPREGSWPNHYQNGWPQAPLTPPDSGYGTPEYFNSAASVNSRYIESFNQAIENQSFHRSFHAPSGNYLNNNGSQYHPGYPGHKWWDAGVADCNCSHCIPSAHAKAGPYFQSHGHVQPVMG
ncbi:hypothetical protein GGS20DRAFT_464847 [Poronia punctata]|nr:hypothetical protein GGS20DRAFT_464847 [Poronia punctata]